MVRKTEVVVEVSASQAAAALSKSRWAKTTPAQKAKQLAKLRAGNRKISRKKRSEIASLGGKSVQGEAARQRALKAWETKRKNAARNNSAA